MAQAWPATVPAWFDAESYDESAADNLIKSSPDVGPQKVRRRSTSAPKPFSGRILMTSTQLATFDEFYRVTLCDGALTFMFNHPRTKVSVECRIKAGTPPKYSPLGGIYWFVSLEMEKLP